MIFVLPYAVEQIGRMDRWLKAKYFLHQDHFLGATWTLYLNLFVNQLLFLNFDFDKLVHLGRNLPALFQPLNLSFLAARRISGHHTIDSSGSSE